MKVLFLHGLESKPGGSKAKALKEAGFEVLNPALPKTPFDISVKIAQDVINVDKPDVIVGSSRGGAVAMAVNARGAAVILIAPAWKKYGVSKKIESAIILHSETDDIVPFCDTEELVKENSNIKLIKCKDDHRMRKKKTLKKIVECVNNSTKA